MIDPVRNLLLSPNEYGGNFEIISLTSGLPNVSYINKQTGVLPTIAGMDSAAEDCSTGIALASIEDTSTMPQLYLADIEYAVKNKGFQSPNSGNSSGTWTAPQSIFQFIPNSYPAGLDRTTFQGNEFDAVAVAQGTHTGVLSSEWGGNLLIAFSLPDSSGTGATPTVKDWVTCGIPPVSGMSWAAGKDPHTVTAYRSPNTGDAMALVANQDATYLALIDLTKMLALKRVGAGSNGIGGVCADGLLPTSVVTFIPVP